MTLFMPRVPVARALAPAAKARILVKVDRIMKYESLSTRRPAPRAVVAAPQNRRMAEPVREHIAAEAPLIVSDLAAKLAARRRVEVVETYFGANGRPKKRKGLGAASVARRYDEHGNQVEEAYFNAGGKPTLRKDLGVARIAWSYDESGNRTEAAFFGADGAPIARKVSRASRDSAQKLFTMAIRKPSQPLEPTV